MFPLVFCCTTSVSICFSVRSGERDLGWRVALSDSSFNTIIFTSCSVSMFEIKEIISEVSPGVFCDATQFKNIFPNSCNLSLALHRQISARNLGVISVSCE